MAHLVITIGCEYGAKGNRIDRRVAEDLGIKFYDRETVDEIIKEVGIPKDIMEKVEQGVTIAGKGAEGDTRGAFSKYADLTERAIHVQKTIIRKLADRESCVIIGRSADYILKEQKPILRVFIYAPDEVRIENVMKSHNLSADDARLLIEEKDKSYVRCERSYGNYARSFDISGIKAEGIKASYNPGDFDAEELDNIATLYQKMNKNVWNVNGPYIAQIDDYRNGETADRDKVVVTNPVLQAENGDLVASVKDYKVGTNGSLFSPQGGLRVSPNEMKVLIEMFLNDGKVNGKQILTKKSVDEMFTPVWTYNDETKNGHTSGLFYSYGLGIQTMSSTHYDRLLKDRDVVLAGHFGEAYGLLAGMFMDRSTGTVIYYAMTGMGSPEDENYGEYSGMYKWEEKFCTALLNDLFPEL